MRPTMPRVLALVLLCVLPAVLLSLSCAFDADGDYGVIPRLVGASARAPDQFVGALPESAAQWHHAQAFAQRLAPSPGLLAAVPGGLRLLI